MRDKETNERHEWVCEQKWARDRQTAQEVLPLLHSLTLPSDVWSENKIKSRERAWLVRFCVSLFCVICLSDNRTLTTFGWKREREMHGTGEKGTCKTCEMEEGG